MGICSGSVATRFAGRDDEAIAVSLPRRFRLSISRDGGRKREREREREREVANERADKETGLSDWLTIYRLHAVVPSVTLAARESRRAAAALLESATLGLL